MSDTNDKNDVLAQHDPQMRLARENDDLRRRLAALEKNVVNGGFTGEAPRYLLNEPCFLDDTWFGTGTQIDYLGTPNLTMVPMNDPARRKIDEHIEMLQTGARRKAAASGRDFHGLVSDRNVLLDLARLDAQSAAEAPVPVIAVPVPHGTVPAMPHTDEARAMARRGPGRPRKVIASEGPSQQRPQPGADRGAPILAPAPSDQIGPAVVGRMAG